MNSKRRCKVEIGPIRGPDGSMIRENKECAEVLNAFFSSVFTNADSAKVLKLSFFF